MLIVSLVSVSGCRRRWNTFHICCLIFRNVSFLFTRLLWFNLLWFHPKHSYKTVVYFQTDIFHWLLTNPSLLLKPNADQESVNISTTLLISIPSFTELTGAIIVCHGAWRGTSSNEPLKELNHCWITAALSFKNSKLLIMSNLSFQTAKKNKQN